MDDLTGGTDVGEDQRVLFWQMDRRCGYDAKPVRYGVLGEGRGGVDVTSSHLVIIIL